MKMTTLIRRKMKEGALEGLKNRIVANYRDFTDKYFLRSNEILQAEGINPIVRYQVFARQDIPKLEGVDMAVELIKQTTGEDVKIYALKDGMSYKSGEPLMKLEGPVQSLVELETVYLGLLSGAFTGELGFGEMRERARAIKQAAEDKPVLYFGARHFHPLFDEGIAEICQEEGFVGCSTDIGARAWDAKGKGTIPHALILAVEAYMKEQGIDENPTVYTAKLFDRNIDSSVPRIVLMDTYNREITDSIATARAVPSVKGFRIDTCGENYTEGSEDVILPHIDVDEKYLRGRGVKIASVWGLRNALDRAGFRDLELTVSSGFNEEKTAAFLRADKVFQAHFRRPLFNAIGTGSLAKPVMTTSDIVAYFSQNQGGWLAHSKIGRGEVESDRLEEIK